MQRLRAWHSIVLRVILSRQSAIANEQLGYGYDGGWNMTQRTVNGSPTTYTVNDRNQVTAVKRYNNDLVKTEQSFNFVEIPSLFGRHLSETDDEEDRLLADILCEIWHTRLHTLFAERSFHVAILEPKETGGELGLIFHQNLSIKCKIP